jgi:NADP-dependent 3-hydroxy acid dehydrogenase YdfG
MEHTSKVAVVTGASAGIGAATALRLAKEGFAIVLGARRRARLNDVARACGGLALELDVTDPDSVAAFAARVERCDVLINNAGLASGFEPVAELSEERVRTMWETNVMGVLRVTKALLPALIEARGHIVNLGSISSFEVYPGGGGYTASKHALRALTRTLRWELHDQAVRVTEICPGLVETEFSLVRFDGDAERAKAPYRGMQPLGAEDIADAIAWAVTRPPHVDVDEIVIRPVAQVSATVVHREKA